MGREALAPVGSRWIRKDETKGRVFFVLTRKAFGQLEIMQEGRAILGIRKRVFMAWSVSGRIQSQQFGLECSFHDSLPRWPNHS